MRNNLLPIGFATKDEESYGDYGWSYAIVPERLIAYNHGKINEVQVERIEKSLQQTVTSSEEMKRDLVFLLKESEGSEG